MATVDQEKAKQIGALRGMCLNSSTQILCNIEAFKVSNPEEKARMVINLSKELFDEAMRKSFITWS